MRKYKRVDRARRGRLLRAVEMRRQGLSLRQIATALECSHGTVINDLRRWDAERPKVVNLPGQKVTPGGEKLTTGIDRPETDAGNVVQLRRAQ